MEVRAKIVMFSHLSDISYLANSDKTDGVNDKAEFVKYLMHKFSPEDDIDPDAEWENFMKTRSK